MSIPNASKKSVVTLHHIYPELDERELKEAETNFRRYLESALRQFEAIHADPERYARFKSLTTKKPTATMNGKQTVKKQGLSHVQK